MATGTSPPTPHVKGLALLNGMRTIRAVCGEPVAATVLDMLPAELGDSLRYGRVVASSWYPVSYQRTLLRTVCDATGSGLPLARRLGVVSLNADLRGPYRAFAVLIGPQRTLGVSTRFFGRYYDRGTAEIIEARKGFAHVRWNGCGGFGAHVFANIVGACESLLVGVGAKEVRVHVLSGGGEIDDGVEVQGHWL